MPIAGVIACISIASPAPVLRRFCPAYLITAWLWPSGHRKRPNSVLRHARATRCGLKHRPLVLGEATFELSMYSKVEPCTGGDDTRLWPPFEDGGGTIFLSVNRNKRSLALDLKSPGGLDICKRLAREADAVVESFGPGVASWLGIGSPFRNRRRSRSKPAARRWPSSRASCSQNPATNG